MSTPVSELAHEHHALVEQLHGSIRSLNLSIVRDRAEINDSRARDVLAAMQKERGGKRRAKVSERRMAMLLAEGERWELALDEWSESLFTSLDVPSALAEATWTRKRADEKGVMYLPRDADLGKVAGLLREYRVAPESLKPLIRAQIAAVTGGMSPSEAGTALMNTVQLYTSPSRVTVAESLAGGLGAEFWVENGLQIYLQMALGTSELAGMTALEHMGINRTFAWASPQNTARDLFSVRGSKVIQGLYGEHMRELTNIIVEAADPRNPLTVQQVQARIRERWPSLKGYQVARVARTETAAVWTSTSMNTYAANGISEWESTIAHGPSIGVASYAPCDLCIEMASDFHPTGASEIPPWHPNCRCEAVPRLEDEDGTPWLPPDEPWTGGGDVPVCGTLGAVKSMDQRRRLQFMGARVKKAAAQCLTPAPEPGEPFGGVKYSVHEVGSEDEAIEFALNNLRAQIAKEWQLGKSAEHAMKVIDDIDKIAIQAQGAVEGYVWVARDAAGTPLSVAGVQRYLGPDVGDLRVTGMASRSGGSRHTLKRLAQEAYDNGGKLDVDFAALSPQMQKQLLAWGFQEYTIIPGRYFITPQKMEETFGFVKAPDVVPVTLPIEPPPAPSLGETVDELKQQMFHARNKIAGLVARRKKLMAVDGDPVKIAEIEARIAALEAERAAIRAKLKTAPEGEPVIVPEPEPVPQPSVPDEGTLMGSSADAELSEAYLGWSGSLSPDDVGLLHGFSQKGAEVNAKLYTTPKVSEMASHLNRVGWDAPAGTGRGARYLKMFVRDMDRLIKDAPQVEQGMVLYKNLPLSMTRSAKPRAGTTITDPGYLDATPTVPPVTDEVLTEIHVAPGMRGAWLANVVHTPFGQRRFVMPRGLKMRVTKTETRVIDGRKRDVMVVEITNGPRLPPKPHEIPPTPPAELQVVPGEVGKEKGTAALLKEMTEDYRSGASEMKASVMRKLANRVRGKDGWNPQAVADAFNYRLGQYSNDLDEQVMAQMVRNWAHTSSDADARGVAMQIAAKEELGLDVRAFATSYWNDPAKNAEVLAKAEEILSLPGVRSSLRMFMRAQYEETQSRLIQLGVDEVTVYRGLRITGDKPWGAGISTLDVADNPLASWSIKHSVSRRSHFYGGTMLRASVPREMIFSTPLSGFGCASEYEVLILNAGRNRAWVAQTGQTPITAERRAELTEIRDRQQELVDRLQQEIEQIRSAGPANLGYEAQNSIRMRANEQYYARQRLSEAEGALDRGTEKWHYEKETELRAEIAKVLDRDPSLAGSPRPVPTPEVKPRTSRPNVEGGLTLAQARNRVKNIGYRLSVELKKSPINAAKINELEGQLQEARDAVAVLTQKSRVRRIRRRLGLW